MGFHIFGDKVINSKKLFVLDNPCACFFCIFKQAIVRAGVQVKERRDNMTAGKMKQTTTTCPFSVVVFALHLNTILKSLSHSSWLQLIVSYRLILIHQTTRPMKSLTRTRKPSSATRTRWGRQSRRPYLLNSCCCGVVSLHWSWC